MTVTAWRHGGSVESLQLQSRKQSRVIFWQMARLLTACRYWFLAERESSGGMEAGRDSNEKL